jgi:hypothetical protein
MIGAPQTARPAVIFWLIAGAVCSSARADSGTPCWSGRAGAYETTVFAAPNPPRVGPLELNVLLQDAATHSLASGARIAFRLANRDQPQLVRSAEATAEVPSNRLLRGATVELPESGLWLVEVAVEERGHSARATFEIQVAEALPRWLALWPWFGWPVLAVGLYATHQVLVARRRPLSRR